MTLSSSVHPDDEDLELFADGFQPAAASSRIAAHLTNCISCSTTIEEARRGLATLALAIDPPADLERLAMARKWAASHTKSSLNMEGDADADLREVGGRDMEREKPEGSPDDDKIPDRDH